MRSFDVKEQDRRANGQNDYINQITRVYLTNLYENLGLVENFQNLETFMQSNTFSKAAFLLDHSQLKKEREKDSPDWPKKVTGMLRDFEKFDNFLFSFTPVIADDAEFDELASQASSTQSKNKKNVMMIATEEFDQVIFDQLSDMSSSLRYVRFDQVRTTLQPIRKQALQIAYKFFDNMKEFDRDKYESEFYERRNDVFRDGIRALFKINKGGLLNGFNLRYLSLPLEHSVQHNYLMY